MRVTRTRWLAGVALALLCAACGRAPGDIPLVGTPAPTFTLAPAGQLNWRAHLPPVVGIPQYGAIFGNPALALAQSDGRVAYECVAGVQGGASGARVWVTRDGTAHWERAADLVTGGAVDSCPITVDDLTPTTAVTLTFRDAHDNCMDCGDGTYLNFITEDAGTTWRPLRGPDDVLRQFATFHGTTYALWVPHPADLAMLHSTLVVSHDGLRTWSAIDGAITAGNAYADPSNGRFATRFWVNPVTGVLLVLSSTSFVESGQFWASSDGGQNWTQVRTPAADDYIVQYPSANQAWQMCGLHTSTSNARPTIANVLTCTADSGRTWVDRGGAPDGGNIFAIAGDGSILEDIAGGAWSAGANAHFELTRLAPGSSQWVSLGPIPYIASGIQMDYVAGAGSGTVWEFADNGGTPPANPTVAQMTFYSAAYA